jgi:hypothetical protein
MVGGPHRTTTPPARRAINFRTAGNSFTGTSMTVALRLRYAASASAIASASLRLS